MYFEGVYTNVGVMNTALLFDQPTKDRRDEKDGVPVISEKFYEVKFYLFSCSVVLHCQTEM